MYAIKCIFVDARVFQMGGALLPNSNGGHASIIKNNNKPTNKRSKNKTTLVLKKYTRTNKMHTQSTILISISKIFFSDNIAGSPDVNLHLTRNGHFWCCLVGFISNCRQRGQMVWFSTRESHGIIPQSSYSERTWSDEFCDISAAFFYRRPWVCGLCFFFEFSRNIQYIIIMQL